MAGKVRIFLVLAMIGWAALLLNGFNVLKLRSDYRLLWREHYDLQQSGGEGLLEAFEYKSEALREYSMALEDWLVLGLLPGVLGLLILAVWPVRRSV